MLPQTIPLKTRPVVPTRLHANQPVIPRRIRRQDQLRIPHSHQPGLRRRDICEDERATPFFHCSTLDLFRFSPSLFLHPTDNQGNLTQY